MIFAVHTFSVEVLDALLDIGELHLDIPKQKEYIDSYYMLWHYIGRALGTMDEINPTTYEDGKRLQQIIYDKQFITTKSNVKDLVPPLVQFIANLLSTKDNKKVYSVVRYYNRGENDRKIFRDIMKIDVVNDSSKFFYFLISVIFVLIKGIAVLIFALIPKADRENEAHKLFKTNYVLLGKIIYVASNGAFSIGKHFRIADGFGLPAPQIDYSQFQNQEPFFTCFLKICAKKLMTAIGDFFKRPFTSKTSVQNP